jgi:hypothetical protein
VYLVLVLAALCIGKFAIAGCTAAKEWHQLYVYVRNLSRIALRSVPVLGHKLGTRGEAAETSVVYRFAAHFL